MKLGARFRFGLTFLFLGGCISVRPGMMKSRSADLVEITPGPSGQLWGGFSGLYFAREESTAQEQVYYALTDRGPNAEPHGRRRPFLDPTFAPRIVRLIVSGDRPKVARTVAEFPFHRKNGRLVSGLPNNHGDESPVRVDGRPLRLDPQGVDSEGLVKDPAGGFWIVEEYGPSLVKTDGRGTVEGRWLPGEGLPRFLRHRELNRGFEGVAWSKNRTLLLFLQSPVTGDTSARLIPIVEFDPVLRRTVGLYYYRASREGGKIGDATLGPDGSILVIEQNGQTGSRSWQRLVRVSLDGAENVVGASEAAGEGFRPPADVRSVGRVEVADLRAYGLDRFSKLEGLTVGPDGKIVVLNDNDFGVVGPGSSYLIFLQGVKL